MAQYRIRIKPGAHPVGRYHRGDIWFSEGEDTIVAEEEMTKEIREDGRLEIHRVNDAVPAPAKAKSEA